MGRWISRTGRVYNNGVLIDTEEYDLSWDDIRHVRSVVLKYTDLWYLKDRWDTLNTTEKGKLNSFRQGLRDLPSTYATANDAADNFPEGEEWFFGGENS